MTVVEVRDRAAIETFLRKDVYRHLYGIGDLDDFFFGDTAWYGFEEGGELRALILLYTGLELPALLALDAEREPLAGLAAAVAPQLPDHFYAHLSPGVAEALSGRYTLESHGVHHKMALRDHTALEGIDTSCAVRLTEDDAGELLELYAASYPGHWFEPHMLRTGQYFGVREGGKLASIAGVHVYSSRYRVAALGNIATHPDHRRKGLGRVTTAALCRSLCAGADHIGLNVKADNTGAAGLYARLGFTCACAYEEFMVRAV
jgi:GNAT superfamily N-acetyltransferase